MILTLISVTAFTEESFKKINGYSNEYWGWGGEDDDISHRMFEVYRPGYIISCPDRSGLVRGSGLLIRKKNL